MSWESDPPVYRTKPLPTGALRGEYLLAGDVLDTTREELVGFALKGIRDCGHEGLVFWGGRQSGDLTAITTVIVPEVQHSHGRVNVSRRAYGIAARRARKRGILLLAQVHSHPGSDNRHSDGDDEMIGLPTEGMLSVVVPNFGVRFCGLADAGVHQFQEGRWVLCSEDSVEAQMKTPPSKMDARP
jgi:proteasome lid subunit RPN8/RPN11